MKENRENTTENTQKSRRRVLAYSKKQRLIFGLLALVFLGIAVFAGVKIIEILSDNGEGDDYYKNIMSEAVETTEAGIDEAGTTEEEKTTEYQTVETGTEEPSTGAEPQGPTQEIDFNALWEINKDVCAWIEIPGTVVNYPIVQGKDNNQYLRTLLDGSYHRFGTLFVDAGNTPGFSDDITIIYGHHIYAGYMFDDVENYSDPEFYRSHKDIWLYTPDKTYRLEPYCANIIAPTYFITTRFESQQAYQEYIDSFQSSTYLDADTRPDANYKTVVLFTCSEAERGNRFVLFCRLSEYIGE